MGMSANNSVNPVVDKPMVIIFKIFEWKANVFQSCMDKSYYKIGFFTQIAKTLNHIPVAHPCIPIFLRRRMIVIRLSFTDIDKGKCFVINGYNLGLIDVVIVQSGSNILQTILFDCGYCMFQRRAAIITHVIVCQKQH